MVGGALVTVNMAERAAETGCREFLDAPAPQRGLVPPDRGGQGRVNQLFLHLEVSADL